MGLILPDLEALFHYGELFNDPLFWAITYDYNYLVYEAVIGPDGITYIPHDTGLKSIHLAIHQQFDVEVPEPETYLLMFAMLALAFFYKVKKSTNSTLNAQ